MITELILVGSGYYVATNIDIMMLKKKWKGICNSQGKFTNQNSKTLKIINIKRTEYGYIIKVELPYSYTKTDLERDLDIFKEGLKMQSMQITSIGNVVDLYCVKEYQFHDYEPIKLPPNKLLIAEGLIEPIIIDMNKFPHMLIGGDTGTGKSRILLLLLANLIKHSHDVELYMLQIRKNDLGVFNNCKQVKCNSKSLEDVLFALRDIDKECLRREQLIDNTKGYYNIEDYNKAHPKEKLKYTYVIIEEFSFLNTSRGDSTKDKCFKNEALKHIKMLVNVGRSSGVFLITALQKPTKDSIPSDIKAQLTTRVALKIADTPASIVILGNDKATDLQEREVLVRTLGEKSGYSYTINHDMIKESIKNMELKETKIAPKKIEENKKQDSNFEDIMTVLNALNK